MNDINFNLDKAFKIIRRNYGCPGPDGLSIKEIKKDYKKHKKCLYEQVTNNAFQFTVPRSQLIVTGGPKTRRIHVYNLYDRWIQECIKLAIEPYLEKFLEKYTFAYRKSRGKGHKAAAKYILKNKPNYILKLDIVDFFPNVNQQILMNQLATIAIPNNLLKFIRDSLAPTPKGLPTGHVLCPQLSNVYLSPIDKLFSENYARYCDDMLFVVSNEKEKSNIIDKVGCILKKLDLTLNTSKTKLISSPTEEKILT